MKATGPHQPQTPDVSVSGAPLPRRTRLALGAVGVLLLVAVTMGVFQALTHSRGDPALRIPRMTMLSEPRALPPLDIRDAAGNPVSFDRFRGKVVLLNLWATWCAPCGKEMPALDRLQASIGGPQFAVVALATDVGGVKAVKEFYAANNVQHLAIYVDGASKVLTALGTAGLPTTLLLDAEGREVGRYLGAADWESEEFAQVLRPHLERARREGKG
ncbi:MAG: TlpA disulfide reductase family protein [Burkholderiales bacterium]